MISIDRRAGGDGYWVADSMDDLKRDGWTVLLNEAFKPGVARCHCTRGGAGSLRPEFQIIYVSVEPTPAESFSQWARGG